MKNKNISEKTGLSPAEISRIWNGWRNPSWRQSIILSKSFGRSIKWWRTAEVKEMQIQIRSRLEAAIRRAK